MPDFRSDTVTQPTPAMREAMFKAPLGDDVFADDPSVNALQEHAAQLLGFEAALFAPSGTQTNLIALWGHCQRGDEAIVGQSWHTYRWEAGGMAVLGSIQPQPVETQPDGTLRLADIAAAIKPDDPHFARTRLVVLENTTGGQVLPPAYVAVVAQLARSRGLALHLDGARLFNAATANAARNGTDVYDEARTLCSHFDSVSLCLSKGLGAPVGSLVLGTRDFIRGRPGWCVSVALVVDGAPELGVLYAPALDELWVAQKGKGATLNGETLRASRRMIFDGARVPADSLPKIDRDLIMVTKPNSIALRMALVADDRADLVATLRWGFEWDVAAAALIAAEAGATVTDAFGEPLRFNTPRAQAFGVIACAPGIHRAVVARLHDRAVALTSPP